MYAKWPFGGPGQVIEHLGRYTHKVAIANHRLEQVDEQEVTFRYKDYKADGAVKLMTLSNGEFTRRFSQHIVPQRFVRIRHYGILSSSWKRGPAGPATGAEGDKTGAYCKDDAAQMPLL